MNDGDAFSMDFDGTRYLSFSSSQAILNPASLRVYAAGPLTNNSDAISRDCADVRSILKRVLGSYDHQGIRFQVYDPGDVTQPGSSHTPEEVYELNHEQSVLADLVVFHVTTPSLGVGCEAQIAADATVPRVTLVRKDVALSRMFDGIFSTTIASIHYENHADLELQLFRQLPSIAAQATRSALQRRPRLTAFSELQLGSVIFKQRILHNVTINELARQTDIKESWLRRLERKQALAACCTAIQLDRIAAATRCYVKIVDAQNMMTLAPSDDSLSEDQRQSLENLVTYVSSKDGWVTDDRVFRLWNGYRVAYQTQRDEALQYREGDNKVLSVEAWRQRDQEPRLF